MLAILTACTFVCDSCRVCCEPAAPTPPPSSCAQFRRGCRMCPCAFPGTSFPCSTLNRQAKRISPSSLVSAFLLFSLLINSWILPMSSCSHKPCRAISLFRWSSSIFSSLFWMLSEAARRSDIFMSRLSKTPPLPSSLFHHFLLFLNFHPFSG